MLRKVVVVAPHFLSKTCESCNSSLVSNLIRCSGCGTIQPFPSFEPSPFEVLNFAPEPQLNENELRGKFYELSKLTHPDAVVQLSEDQKRRAHEWSAAVNRSYRVLKDPLLRLEELIHQFEMASKNPPSASLELAEAYFDFQDQWSSGNKESALGDFMKVLNQEESQWTDLWSQLVSSWSVEAPAETSLALLKRVYEGRKYLDSVKGDLLKYQVKS